MTRTLSRRTLAKAAIATLILSRAAFGQNFTWAGNSGNWSDSSQWIGGTMPAGDGTLDTVTFGSAVSPSGYSSNLDTTAVGGALPDPFIFNQLDFADTSANNTVTNTLNGGTIELSDPAPSINDSSTNGSVTFAINNQLILADDTTVNDNGSADLQFNGSITGPGTMIINGNSTVEVNGDNSFEGGLDFQGGTLALGYGDVPGLAPAKIITAPGRGIFTIDTRKGGTAATALTLKLKDGATIANPTTILGANSLTINNPLDSASGTLSGPVSLVSKGATSVVLDLVVAITNTFTIDGVIQNEAGAAKNGVQYLLTSEGEGTLVLSGANVFGLPAGPTASPSFNGIAGTTVITVDSGPVRGVFTSPFGIGSVRLQPPADTTFTLLASGTAPQRAIGNALILKGAGTAAFGGGSIGLVFTGATTVDTSQAIYVQPQSNLGFNGVISNASATHAGGINKYGRGTLSLNNTNTFTGNVNLILGAILVTKDGALGDWTKNSTTVSNRAELVFKGPLNYTQFEAVTINGFNLNGQGAIHNIGGNTTFAGPVTLASDSIISTADTFTLKFTAPVDQNKMKVETSGGATGKINFSKGVTNPPAPVVNIKILPGTSGAKPLDSTGGLQVDNGFCELDADNDYVGPTAVMGGTLLVDGSLDASGSDGVDVSPNAVLGGNGSISRPIIIESGGAIAPGDSVGTLSVSDLSLSSGSQLDFDLGAVGSAQDFLSSSGQLTLNGTVNINDIGGFGNGVYQLMNWASIQPGSTMPALAPLPDGLTGYLELDPNVSNTLDLVVTPEPGAISFFLAASGLLASKRRKKQS